MSLVAILFLLLHFALNRPCYGNTPLQPPYTPPGRHGQRGVEPTQSVSGLPPCLDGGPCQNLSVTMLSDKDKDVTNDEMQEMQNETYNHNEIILNKIHDKINLKNFFTNGKEASKKLGTNGIRADNEHDSNLSDEELGILLKLISDVTPNDDDALSSARRADSSSSTSSGRRKRDVPLRVEGVEPLPKPLSMVSLNISQLRFINTFRLVYFYCHYLFSSLLVIGYSISWRIFQNLGEVNQSLPTRKLPRRKNLFS